MIDDSYLAQFIDAQHPEDIEALPKWVSSKNSSLKSYQVICELKKYKDRYIRSHGNKTDYTLRSSYQITKAEVAKIVGVNPQPLFNSNSYSRDLTNYFDSVNKALEDKKIKRLAKKQGGLKQKQKAELIKQIQDDRKRNADAMEKTVDELFQKTLDSMSLDVKRKLGLV
ncbi:hypothetical protein [uncultured Spongiibacter sp.]|uniref:hypothetical protein n=1 Tax=uncultured Spongiibacter sp. TaxID=870896 RepID=UPI0025953483|nr:hypothetical protein [uncultured Spongiibacter sp.]